MDTRFFVLLVVFVVVSWLVLGAFTAYVAKEKGRSPLAWGALGFLFGLVALLAIGFVPTRSREAAVGPPPVSPDLASTSPNSQLMIGAAACGFALALLSYAAWPWLSYDSGVDLPSGALVMIGVAGLGKKIGVIGIVTGSVGAALWWRRHGSSRSVRSGVVTCLVGALVLSIGLMHYWMVTRYLISGDAVGVSLTWWGSALGALVAAGSALYALSTRRVSH